MPQGKKTEGEKEDITEQPPVLQVVFVIQKRPCKISLARSIFYLGFIPYLSMSAIAACAER